MHLPSYRSAETGVAHQLGAVLVLVQLGVLDVCAVRVAVDLLHRSLGVEGKVALAGAALMTTLLGRNVLSRRRFDAARAARK